MQMLKDVAVLKGTLLGHLQDLQELVKQATVESVGLASEIEAIEEEQRKKELNLLQTSSCNNPNLRKIIRDVVREEIRKLLPAAAHSALPSIAEIVREEVQQVLQPVVLVSAAPQPPTLSYATAIRRPPPPAHQYMSPPRLEPPAPQYSRRQKAFPGLVLRRHCPGVCWPAPRRSSAWFAEALAEDTVWVVVTVALITVALDMAVLVAAMASVASGVVSDKDMAATTEEATVEATAVPTA
ncbi:hypothetical protein HPB47_004022 [Ixodes persulcatus]|uniref:Uncharacterized protein n=1 Tax=Ixodes persulcatus TaxID=34615 RepID=A0AC60PGT7_IXOPE|nr:hypothetical protein HPB47_004022 [Ixodes persulcatus]